MLLALIHFALMSTSTLYIQTRQLNIWDFERTGSKGWQHKDFIRGRPDLLEHIVRTENKSKSAGAVKRNMMWTSCSVSRGNVSSRSAVSRNAPEAKRKRAKTEKVVIDVADESSSFSTSRARADYLLDDRAHLHNLQKHAGTVAAAGTTTSTTFQVTSRKQEPAAQAEAEAEVMLSSVGTSTCSTVGEVAFEAQAQPIDDDESMMFYLADMFGKHESERPSHEDDLWSILSLNRETNFEDLIDL